MLTSWGSLKTWVHECSTIIATLSAEPLVAELMGSLIAAVVIFYIGKTIYSNQNFELILEDDLNKLNLDLLNKSKFISYKEGDINVRIYIPEEFFKKIEKIQIYQNSEWKILDSEKLKNLPTFPIDGKEYFVFVSDLGRNLFIEARSQYLHFYGDFQDLKDVKFYFSASTARGFYPKWRNPQKPDYVIEKIKNGALPIFYWKQIVKTPNNKLKIKIDFLWYDFWVGWFYDQKKKVLYVCPFPMLVIKIWREH